MIRLVSYSSALICLAILLHACDIIEAPYLDNPKSNLAADEQCLEDAQQTDPFAPGSPAIVKKVFFEEMTGHQCGNCPEATEKLHELKTGKYAGRLVAMAIHAGPLANVKSSGKYATEFRTAAGNELYSGLNVFDAVPFGLIDRIEKGLGASTWETKVEQRMNEAPGAGIRVFNCFDPDSNKLTTVIDVKYLVDATENERITVYLIEDNIKDWQKDYRLSDSDIPDYTHHDVFRAALTNVWGEPLSTTAVTNGERFTKSYSFKLRDDYVAANCRIIAFVYNADTDEVRQVEEAPIVQ